jgi:hypothetical protein
MNGASMTRRTAVLLAVSAAAGGAIRTLPGCVRASVDPIEVKPIHITMDVNIRVQRELDEFFSFEDKLLTGNGKTTAATQPRSDARD